MSERQVNKIRVYFYNGGYFRCHPNICSESESHSVVSDSLWTCGLYSPWNSPGQILEWVAVPLLQGIFPTHRSNPGLPHCWQILYQLSHQGSQYPENYSSKLKRVANRVDLRKKLSHHKEKNYVRWWILTKFIVVIILQHIYVSNHCIVHLELTRCYMHLQKARKKTLVHKEPLWKTK